MVSAIMKIIPENKNWIVKEEEKTIFNFLIFPVPSSIVRNLRIDEEIEPERAEKHYDKSTNHIVYTEIICP